MKSDYEERMDKRNEKVATGCATVFVGLIVVVGLLVLVFKVICLFVL